MRNGGGPGGASHGGRLRPTRITGPRNGGSGAAYANGRRSNPGRRTTINHLYYIPLVLAVGIVVGWMLGARSARSETSRLRAELEAVRRDAAAARLGRS